MSAVHTLRIAWFAALALAGSALAGVAAREGAPQVFQREVIRAASLFGGLQPCDVPGVRERLLGEGAHSVAYAGEFATVRTIPWVTGTRQVYLFIVAGTGTVRINSFATEAHAGDFFVIPKGARHAVSAISGTLRAVYVEDKG